MKHILLPVAALLSLTASVQAQIYHNFDGGEGGVGDTGFQAAYNPDPTGFTLGGGRLTIDTQTGDTFGRFEPNASEGDPDADIENVFYDNMTPDAAGTTVDVLVSYANMLEDFQGGGVWLGTDTDHYIRLGVIHNGPNLNVEVLRENEDLWVGRGGPGGDIMGAQTTAGTAPALDNIYLRLVQTGNTAQGFFSLDGTNYTQVGGTFDNVVTGPGQGVNGGATIEGGFKVGVYGFGGNGNRARVSFDHFLARGNSNLAAIPEPGSAAFLLSALPALALWRRKRA